MLRPSMLKLARSEEKRISPDLETDLIDSKPETEPSFAEICPLPKTRPSMPPVPLPRRVRSAFPETFPCPSRMRSEALARSIPFTESVPSHRIVAGSTLPLKRAFPS